MAHLERRANLWYATLVIPKDAREALGKFKFIQSKPLLFGASKPR